MGELIDITGQVFGRLRVAGRAASRNGETRAYWLCKCECGQETIVSGRYLRTGITRSCGCLVRDTSSQWAKSDEFAEHRRAGNTRHGHKRRGQTSPEYKTWLGIKRRCFDPNCKDYPKWGGRGITVCEAWSTSFETFLQDMGPKPSPKHQIDRIDSNDNYRYGNCRWVTPQVQGGENKRSNKVVVVDGKTFQSLAAACRHFGQPKSRVYMRLQSGYSVEEALKFGKQKARAKRPRESYLPKSHPDRTRD